MNISRLIDAPVREVPDRPALVIEDRVTTYGELEQATRACAAALLANGVGAGDRVAVVDVGSVLAVAGVLAAARVGAAAALMNVALTAGELEQLVATAGCAKVGIAGDKYAAALGAAVPAVLREVDAIGGSAGDPIAAVEGTGDALILFTSGTTGLPKAVPISHEVLSARIGAYVAPFDPATPPMVGMMCVPFFHVGGSLGMLNSLASGGTTVIQPRFDAGEWLRLVERHHVAAMFLVPTMMQRILAHPDLGKTDLSSLVSIAYGAAAAPVDLVERSMQAFPGVAFANVFGQTETLGAYTMLFPDDHRRPDRLGSVGQPLPGVEIRIVDPADGSDVAAGEVGELWVQAAQNVVPGWLKTGDLARQDVDGYLYPVGRLSDTINRGGEKFGPIEVETVLRDHPAVLDVAVAGVPDPEMGERVGVAVVVGSPLTSDELRAHCQGRLAHYKMPERVVFVDQLPYNETGKVSRKALAALIQSQSE
jgi:long-chain acyl-CoA synthetase